MISSGQISRTILFSGSPDGSPDSLNNVTISYVLPEGSALVYLEALASGRCYTGYFNKNSTDSIVWKQLVTNSEMNVLYSLDPQIQIPKNSDLNDYTQYGNYISIAASISETLQNCPISDTGFALRVERITGGNTSNFCKQRIIPNKYSAEELWRVKSDGKWQAWKKIEGVTV